MMFFLRPILTYADEAHHAVAPVLKRVIQYFNTGFTIGLMAKDQRPDKKKLETVFGTYSTSLSLKEAMEKEIVAKANVYRIETNIDLSQVRFNGKDYVNADLEKRIRVTSRNELIVNVLEEYFTSGEAGLRQGVIFCVNVNHANEMAKLLNSAGITSASYTGQTKKPMDLMEKFKKKKIRFLCTCNMISEGWDYPELGILVMARPTLSKVLYLQQIGRGLRKTDGNDSTIKQDFFDFLEERDYSLSYKMPFMLAVIKYINSIGDAKIDDVLDDYIAFYQDRIRRGLQVDRSTCPYNEEMLKDRKAICRNMLTNPFEKFERKRFLYYSKDLSVIAMNHVLYSQMGKEDWDKVKTQLQEDLKNYYSEMGGI